VHDTWLWSWPQHKIPHVHVSEAVVWSMDTKQHKTHGTCMHEAGDHVHSPTAAAAAAAVTSGPRARTTTPVTSCRVLRTHTYIDSQDCYIHIHVQGMRVARLARLEPVVGTRLRAKLTGSVHPDLQLPLALTPSHGPTLCFNPRSHDSPPRRWHQLGI